MNNSACPGDQKADQVTFLEEEKIVAFGAGTLYAEPSRAEPLLRTPTTRSSRSRPAGDLPSGERILWRGAPRWAGLAQGLPCADRRVYFGLLVLWRLGDGIAGQSVSELAVAMAWMFGLGLAGVGLLCLLAWLHTWSSLYTITNRRIVMRIGVSHSDHHEPAVLGDRIG